MPNRFRTVNFSMRIRESDELILDYKKFDANMSRSEYLRTLILFAPAREFAHYRPEFAEDFYQKLHAIGNQINEIAHTVNSRKSVRKDDLREMQKVIMAFFDVYDEFVRERVENPY